MLCPKLNHLYSKISTRSFSVCKSLQNKTVLYDFHNEHGAKMVEFGGWSMPIQYNDLSIVNSHHHTRTKASLFDVSHMLQTKMYGKDKDHFLERLLVADVCGLHNGKGTLSVLTNEKGGIIDDLIVNKIDEDCLYVVSNAGCSDKVRSHFAQSAEEARSDGLDIFYEHQDCGLLALQGPLAAKALQTGVDYDLNNLKFMQNVVTTVHGIGGCIVTRCGYTGEDGFEISVPENKTVELASILVDSSDVKLAGLGARDTLRLEAGLCLYGNDIGEDTTPVEAGLVWCIGKRRRKTADFPGAQIILQQIKDKPDRRRIGLVVDKAIARHGASVVNSEGVAIGEVTSGCPSPTLSSKIAMAYVERKYCRSGNVLSVKIRNKQYPATVTKMPFVPANYFF